jgi:hypothetical protein
MNPVDMVQEKKSELVLTVIGIIGSIVTAIMGTGIISEGSMLALILGIIGAVCTYVLQRGVVKVAKFNAVKSYIAKDSVSIKTATPNVDR